MDAYQIVSAIFGGVGASIGLFKLLAKPKFEIRQDGIEYVPVKKDLFSEETRQQSIIDSYDNPDFPIIKDGHSSYEVMEIMTNHVNFYPEREFVNIEVRNNGWLEAKECEISIKLIKKVPEECINPKQGEPERLYWAEGTEKITIEAHHGKKFHLLFKQKSRDITREQFSTITRNYCKIENNKVFPVVWLATQNALRNISYTSTEGLCYGKFIFHLEVLSTTKRTKLQKHLISRIEKDKQIPLVEIAKCDCRDK